MTLYRLPNHSKMSKAPRNVLITGGCGFIGANFVNFAFDYWPESRIVNLDKLILNSDINYVSGKVRNSDRYQLALADIRNSAVVTDILNENKVCPFYNKIFIILNNRLTLLSTLLPIVHLLDVMEIHAKQFKTMSSRSLTFWIVSRSMDKWNASFIFQQMK